MSTEFFNKPNYMTERNSTSLNSKLLAAHYGLRSVSAYHRCGSTEITFLKLDFA